MAGVFGNTRSFSPLSAASLPSLKPLPTAPCRHRRLGRCLFPGAGACLVGVIMQQALMELARYGADGAGIVSIFLGVAAVMVTLMPFAVLFVRRTVGLWRNDPAVSLVGRQPENPCGNIACR